MSAFGAFYDTRNFLINSTGYTHSLSYEEWKGQPEHLKSALLFIEFFDVITFAWDKSDTLDWGDDAEGVSTILQYLQKNISKLEYYIKDDPTKKAGAEFRRNNPDGYITIEHRIIDETPGKYSSAYIYRVAYNCFACIVGRGRQRDADAINHEVSSIIIYEGKELNIVDTIIDDINPVETNFESADFKSQFWSIIEDSGVPTEKVMRYLLSQNPDDLKKLSKRNKLYSKDPLRDVAVSLDEIPNILADLRNKFLSISSNSPCGEYILGLLDS